MTYIPEIQVMEGLGEYSVIRVCEEVVQAINHFHEKNLLKHDCQPEDGITQLAIRLHEQARGMKVEELVERPELFGEMRRLMERVIKPREITASGTNQTVVRHEPYATPYGLEMMMINRDRTRYPGLPEDARIRLVEGELYSYSTAEEARTLPTAHLGVAGAEGSAYDGKFTWKTTHELLKELGMKDLRDIGFETRIIAHKAVTGGFGGGETLYGISVKKTSIIHRVILDLNAIDGSWNP